MNPQMNINPLNDFFILQDAPALQNRAVHPTPLPHHFLHSLVDLQSNMLSVHSDTLFEFYRQVLRSLAPAIFYAAVIVTSANSKDDRPMVFPT